MTWPQDYAHVALVEVDSTNAEAARQSRTLDRPTWISADRQTAARGRRGRAWANPEGNFAATLALPSRDPPDRLALRSFVASLALYEAFVVVTGRADLFALKWPNDVLLNGGKVAGILLETLPQVGLAIGIGVNLATAPAQGEVEDGALRPVSVFGETGISIAATGFVPYLAQAYAAWEARFVTEGFPPIRDAWLARAARLGEDIRAKTVTEVHHGIFETVDQSGALVLTTAKGRMAIPAAEVYF
ncbi:MAG: biotin--[acetyl-CoA-carboxylase] ligase [Pseudomonadota bacterium]